MIYYIQGSLPADASALSEEQQIAMAIQLSMQCSEMQKTNLGRQTTAATSNVQSSTPANKFDQVCIPSLVSIRYIKAEVPLKCYYLYTGKPMMQCVDLSGMSVCNTAMIETSFSYMDGYILSIVISSLVFYFCTITRYSIILRAPYMLIFLQ